MNVLIIDNYDSFVYNIVQIVRKAGHHVDLVENDRSCAVDPGKYDRVIISPGPGNPNNTSDRGSTLDLLKKIKKVPVLGICFGHQLLALALGAEVRQGTAVRHGEIDTIRHNGDSLYRDVPEEFRAVRYHSLVVEKSNSIAIDSVSLTDGTIMGFHSKDRMLYGVQFHPESYYTEFGERILNNFLVM